MLCLTRLNGTQVYVSPVHIVTVESTPDTMIHLHNGDRMMVKESADAIADMLARYIRTGITAASGGELAAVVRLVPPPRKIADEEEG